MKTRHAFTLIELLVVVAIIGILVGMIFPAIQSTRESARQVLCKNNLRNIGFANANFEAFTGRFPPARGRDRYLTWPYFLMPFFERGNFHDQLDGQLPYYSQSPDVLRRPVGLLVCPSRGRRSLISTSEPFDDPLGPVGDYAGNAGSQKYFPGDHWATFDSPVDGVINSGYRIENIIVDGKLITSTGRYSHKSMSDGLSNTIFFGEKYVDRRHFGETNQWGDGSILNGESPETFIRIGGIGMPIASSTTSETTPGELPVFGSAHKSTCNFVFGDGSVHGIVTNISEITLMQLCSRNDSAPIGGWK